MTRRKEETMRALSHSQPCLSSKNPKSLHRINVLEGITQASLAYTVPYCSGVEAHHALKSKDSKKKNIFSSALIKIKVSKLGFHSDAIKEPSLIPQRTFQ